MALHFDPSTTRQIAAYRLARERAPLPPPPCAVLDAVKAALDGVDRSGSEVLPVPSEVADWSAGHLAPGLRLQGGRYFLIFDLSDVGHGYRCRHLSVSKLRNGRKVDVEETVVEKLRDAFGFPAEGPEPVVAPSKVVHFSAMVPIAEA